MASKTVTKKLIDTTNERSKAIDLALGAIEKQFGRGSIMRLDDSTIQEGDVCPTGSLGPRYCFVPSAD